MAPVKVRAAANLFPSRRTFVVPGLPEPEFLGSGSISIEETTIALVKDPIKYPIMVKIKWSMMKD